MLEPMLEWRKLQCNGSAVVWALQDTEQTTRRHRVTAHTAIPIQAWVNDDTVRAHVGVAQDATQWKWKHSLQA